MSASDPKQQPALWRPPAGGADIEHHTREWVSGTAGGGSVPADYEWTSNPRTYAEELGANLPPLIVKQVLPVQPAPAQNSSATKS